MISPVFGDTSDPYGMVGNAGLKLDLFLFGESHLYHGEGIAFDPEGLLSTLPSVVNVWEDFSPGILSEEMEILMRLLLK